MGYERRPGVPDGWAYDGLEIQADVESHRFTVEFARDRFASGARALDVGAGSGALAQQLHDAGLTVTCTSWDGRVRAPMPVFTIDLDSPFTPAQVGGKYDLVCCLEVIEHVENPAALLRSLRGVVTAGGRVVLSTPNVESAQSRLQTFVRGYPLIFHGNEVTKNRHIAMMWREGLEFLARSAGFEIEKKLLLGAPRLQSRLQRLVKGAVYRAMESVLKGDLSGETRLYVLVPSGAAVKSGPADVY